MINIIRREKIHGINSSPEVVNDIQYFGEDALNIDIDDTFNELIRSNIYKECTTYNGDKGIVIGFEDSQSFKDYYFIIYCPKLSSVVYELINDNKFAKNIEK